MRTAGRRIALLTLDANMLRDEDWAPFNYAIRRIHAAVRADPELQDAEVQLFEGWSPSDLDRLSAEVEAFDPDIVGASVYLWSFPTFVEIARRVKRARPDRLVVFGGPSARPVMFELAPYRDAVQAVDVLVVRDGEECFREIVQRTDRSEAALREIRGLAIATPTGFVELPPRTQDTPLDLLASPYQMDLVPDRITAHLETFRGCPLSCAFCEWGAGDRTSRVFSVDYLVREIEAFQRLQTRGAFLVDAALNLNARAFRNLRAAEAQVGFFREALFSCEIYPTLIKDEHLEFLSQVKIHHIGVGLQSYDKEVLARIDRPFDERKFEQGLASLAKVTQPTCEIIMGLPGDTPATFRRTLERVMQQPCNFLVYHCLVLPDGLMTRAPAGSDMIFDPYSLKMTSCWGWSEKDFRDTIEMLDGLVERTGGSKGEYFWLLPQGGDAHRRRQEAGSPGARRPSTATHPSHG